MNRNIFLKSKDSEETIKINDYIELFSDDSPIFALGDEDGDEDGEDDVIVHLYKFNLENVKVFIDACNAYLSTEDPHFVDDERPVVNTNLHNINITSPTAIRRFLTNSMDVSDKFCNFYDNLENEKLGTVTEIANFLSAKPIIELAIKIFVIRLTHRDKKFFFPSIDE